MEKRLFIPGSEWLYFKLYCGSKSADSILINHILPLSELLIADGLIKEWFFIRYSDPQFHVRLRFFIPNAQNYSAVFSRVYPILEKLIEELSIHKVMCDSYSREIERYGEERYRDTETLFCIDSSYVLKILNSLNDIADKDMGRWESALHLIDDTLNAFNLSSVEKRDFMLSQSEGFKKEFGYVSIPFIRQLNDKYRDNRKHIESVFSEGEKVFPPETTTLFSQRLEHFQRLSSKILFPSQTDKSELYGYLSSIIHMTMNRLFHSSNRMYEMVLYDFMHRFYKSQIARESSNKNSYI